MYSPFYNDLPLVQLMNSRDRSAEEQMEDFAPSLIRITNCDVVHLNGLPPPIPYPGLKKKFDKGSMNDIMLPRWRIIGNEGKSSHRVYPE